MTQLAVPSAGAELVRIVGMTKIYHTGGEVAALRGIDLTVQSGEFVAIIGQSGSGKSTLLNMLGCLDRPTGGEYWLAGHHVNELDADRLADLRNEVLGFVFQSFHLLPRLTALENVMLPLTYDRAHRCDDPEAAARKALTRMGLGDRVDHRPAQLSGGQQQRVAIARALVNSPGLLLADEPTGNLDSAMAAEILDVFAELNREGVTVLMITHDPGIARRALRTVEIRDGYIVSDVANGHAPPKDVAA
ncbi:MAG: ABC transporter ATP-binding protein [Candidatus Obscuribacterales bacterium]|nr:ABC transporter ATP-binding protein [Steroidobacteraceae bacterium]